MESEKVKYAAGAAAGLAVGGATSAGAAVVAQKVLTGGINVVARTAKLSAPAASRLAGNAGLALTAVTLGLSGYGAYLAARRANAEGRSTGGVAAAALGGFLGASESAQAAAADSVEMILAQSTPTPRPPPTARPTGPAVAAPEVVAQGTVPTNEKARKKGDQLPPRSRPDQRSATPPSLQEKAADAQREAQKATDPTTKKRWENIADGYIREMGPKDAAPPPAKSLSTEIWETIKSIGARDPAHVQRQESLSAEIDRLRSQAAVDSKRTGAVVGPNQKYYDARIAEKQAELKTAIADEKKDNVFRTAFETAMPIGAGLGGLLLGGRISGADKIAKEGTKAAKQIGKLANEASKLTSRGGVIAGTVAGDRAKAAVEQVGKMMASGVGRPSLGDWALPAINAAIGVGGIAYSQYWETNEAYKRAERIVGGMEIGLALGQTKALAKLYRPMLSLRAASQLAAAEKRIAREVATGAAGKISRINAGRAVAGARAGAEMAGNLTGVRVSGTRVARDMAAIPAIQAAGKRGIAQADKAGDLVIAGAETTRRGIRSAQRLTAARKSPLRGALDPTREAVTASNGQLRGHNGIQQAAGRAQDRVIEGPKSLTPYVNRDKKTVYGTADQIKVWNDQKRSRRGRR